jgi:hypothetical protein
VEYRERGVFKASEMVARVREVEALGKDLFVVGKTSGLPGLTAGMAEWSECPELGPIGDLLASRDFQTMGVRAGAAVLCQAGGHDVGGAGWPTAYRQREGRHDQIKSARIASGDRMG